MSVSITHGVSSQRAIIGPGPLTIIIRASQRERSMLSTSPGTESY